ncbi:hypothetical protein [Pseudomonas sp. A-B-19]
MSFQALHLGTNNKKLREWKSAHGRELVEAWREI